MALALQTVAIGGVTFIIASLIWAVVEHQVHRIADLEATVTAMQEETK